MEAERQHRLRIAYKESAKENVSVFEWGGNGNYRYLRYFYFVLLSINMH